MKALLQVGPAQFIIEGASFHLLCEDIQLTLAALVELQESTISLTLHVEALEACLADDAELLTAAGIALPRPLPGDDDGDDETSSTAGHYRALHRLRAARQTPLRHQQQPERSPTPTAASSPLARHVTPTAGQRTSEPRHGPLFIFSAESFDAAEAHLQRLHTRMLEQRLLLDEVELMALRTYGDALAWSAPARVLPLPIVQLDPYLSTSADVQSEYDAEGHRRRFSATLTGASSDLCS